VIRRSHRCWVISLYIFVTAFHMASTAAQEASSAEVKAAFLYNFGLYIDWPNGALSDVFDIAVVGDDEVAEQLPRFVQGRKIHDKTVRIKKIRSIADFDGAQVLYIGSNAQVSTQEMQKLIDRRGLLVVTDNARRLNSVINFVDVGNRIRFEIFLNPAERAGLKLNSRLLGAAVQVEQSAVH